MGRFVWAVLALPVAVAPARILAVGVAETREYGVARRFNSANPSNPGRTMQVQTNQTFRLLGQLLAWPAMAIRFQETRRPNGNASLYRAVVESYNVLPAE